MCTLCEDADEGGHWGLWHLEDGRGGETVTLLRYKEPVGGCWGEMSQARGRGWEESNGEGVGRKRVLWVMVLGRLRGGPRVLVC